MSIEAMKQALEALEKVKANADDWQERTGKEIKGWMQPVNDSITSLRQAIAEAEKQEPVAVVDLRNANYVRWLDGVAYPKEGAELYTTPPNTDQSPVAWRIKLKDGYQYVCDERMLVLLDQAILREPLYTSPPQRQPLTDEEAMDAYCETPPFGTYKEAFIAGIRFIEADHGIKGE